MSESPRATSERTGTRRLNRLIDGYLNLPNTLRKCLAISGSTLILGGISAFGALTADYSAAQVAEFGALGAFCGLMLGVICSPSL